ncbi:MAG TPA: M14 family zinc carboxypeptidase, partial [Anaerolineaceae bacterium]|nr:M14 family zinc carboxypeptidase [Anaerolineaceae bacterium]
MSGVKLYRLLSLLAVLLLATMAAAPFPQAPANPGCPPAGCPAPGEMVVARVDYGIRARLDALAPALDIWEVHAAEGWLLAQIPYSSVADLQAQGYTVAVDWEQTAALHQPNLPLAGQTQGIPSYPCYRTVEETYTALQTLATTYPGLVMLTDIGDSWDKVTAGGPAGYDILEITLTNGEIPGPKPVFFLMAEIHAREYVTAETATRLAEHLTANYGVDPDITWLLDYNEIHIVPMTNPDGRKFAEAGQSWRKNTDNDDGCASTYGTDLNRNHSFHWGGASTNPCGETYQGPSAGSEPETQVIQNYVLGVLADRRGPGDTDPAPL